MTTRRRVKHDPLGRAALGGAARSTVAASVSPGRPTGRRASRASSASSAVDGGDRRRRVGPLAAPGRSGALTGAPRPRASSQRLQDHRGGDLVDDLRGGPGPRIAGSVERPVGGHRGEPLVEGLHRHADHGSQRPAPRPMAALGGRARASRPGDSGRPTTTSSASSSRDERGDRGGGRGARDPLRCEHGERRGDRAGAVADGDADALRRRGRAPSARTGCTVGAAADRRRAAMRERLVEAGGSLPPAVATSPLPPPPPPTALAASLMQVAGRRAERRA